MLRVPPGFSCIPRRLLPESIHSVVVCYGFRLHPTLSATAKHTPAVICCTYRRLRALHSVSSAEAESCTVAVVCHSSAAAAFALMHARRCLRLFFISRTTLDGIRGPCRTAPTLERSRRGSSVIRPAATSGQQTTPGAADDVSVYCNVFRAADESRDGSFSTFWVARPGL